MIGIIGAMEVELDKLIDDLEEKNIKKIGFLDFYIGKLYNKKVVIVKSNEGKVNSSVATEILILNFDVEYILNVGVAGAVDKRLKVFDIVISKNTVEFDQDTTVLGYEKGYTFGLNEVYVSCCDKVCESLFESTKKCGFNSYIGTVVSSDKFVTDEKEKLELKSAYNALCTDMESASINHVAKLNNIDFVALRVISDSGNKVDYRKFVDKAADNISVILKEFFKEEIG